MWLLFAIFLFTVIFIFIQRKELKQKQNKQADHPSQNQEMQIHSVVTDVVHEDNTRLNQEDIDLEVNEEHKTEPSSINSEDQPQAEMSDFLIHLSSLKKQFEMTYEWRLFDSDAALLWHKNNPIVTILCLTSFSKGKANSLIYKDYHFHIESWAWHGPSPKGAATEIKKTLTERFKNTSS